MIRIILRLSLLFLATIIALVIAEIYLRVSHPQSTIDNIMAFYDYKCYQPLPYYWNGLKPNSNCPFNAITGEFEPTTVKVNSLGLRGKEVSIDKPEGVKRILFIGDSYTFGLGVNGDKTFAYLTEKILNQKIKNEKFETINAGVPATGPGYDYLFLKNTGIALKPDVIVIGFYMQNDIPDMINHNWMKDINGLPTKITSSLVYIDSGKMLPYTVPLKYTVPVLRHSHLFSLISNYFQDETRDPAIIDVKDNQEDSIITPETCLYKPDCHTLDDVKRDTKRVYLEMKKITDKHNIKLIVVSIPAPYQITPKNNTFDYNIPIPLLPSEKNYPYKEFSDFFSKNKITFIDPRDELRKYKEDLYYIRDNHFNNAGHQAMAKIISRELINYFDPMAASGSANILN